MEAFDNNIENKTETQHGKRRSDIPEAFLCPITHQIMSDPVMDQQGNSYERAAILQWLKKRSTSPLTQQPLDFKGLRPNMALRSLIEQHLASHPVEEEEGSDEQGSNLEEKSPSTLWIGGLTLAITEDHLREVFCVYGDISSVHFKTDAKHSNKAAAFVNFIRPSEAARNACVSENGTILGGIAIVCNVKESRALAKTSSVAVVGSVKKVSGSKPAVAAAKTSPTKTKVKEAGASFYALERLFPKRLLDHIAEDCRHRHGTEVTFQEKPSPLLTIVGAESQIAVTKEYLRTLFDRIQHKEVELLDAEASRLKGASAVLAVLEQRRPLVFSLLQGRIVHLFSWETKDLADFAQAFETALFPERKEVQVNAEPWRIATSRKFFGQAIEKVCLRHGVSIIYGKGTTSVRGPKCKDAAVEIEGLLRPLVAHHVAPDRGGSLDLFFSFCLRAVQRAEAQVFVLKDESIENASSVMLCGAPSESLSALASQLDKVVLLKRVVSITEQQRNFLKPFGSGERRKMPPAPKVVKNFKKEKTPAHEIKTMVAPLCTLSVSDATVILRSFDIDALVLAETQVLKFLSEKVIAVDTIELDALQYRFLSRNRKGLLATLQSSLAISITLDKDAGDKSKCLVRIRGKSGGGAAARSAINELLSSWTTARIPASEILKNKILRTPLSEVALENDLAVDFARQLVGGVNPNGVASGAASITSLIESCKTVVWKAASVAGSKVVKDALLTLGGAKLKQLEGEHSCVILWDFASHSVTMTGLSSSIDKVTEELQELEAAATKRKEVVKIESKPLHQIMLKQPALMTSVVPERCGITVRYHKDSQSWTLFGTPSSLPPIVALFRARLVELQAQLVREHKVLGYEVQVLREEERAVWRLANKHGVWIEIPAPAQLTWLRIERLSGIRIETHVGDILRSRAECIVNAANENLQHSGGVARAIADACGSALVDESRALVAKGPLAVSECVFTGAGKLSDSIGCVLHAVGPRWDAQNPERGAALLEATLTNIFSSVDQRGVKSISIPIISSSIFGFPVPVAVAAISKATQLYVMGRAGANQKPSLRMVRFVDIDPAKIGALTASLASAFGPSNASLDLEEHDLSALMVYVPKFFWEWRENDGSWFRYNAADTELLDRGFSNWLTKMEGLCIDSRKYGSGCDYEVDCTNSDAPVQRNKRTGWTRPVRMIPNPEASEGDRSVQRTPSATATAAPPSGTTVYIHGLPACISGAWKDLEVLIATNMAVDELPKHYLPVKEVCEIVQRYGVTASSDGRSLSGPVGALKLAKIAVLECLAQGQATAPVPSHWSPQTSNCQLFPLDPASKEFSQVVAQVHATLPKAKIASIERVQNKLLWSKVSSQRNLLRLKWGKDLPHRMLFHGTRTCMPVTIYNGEEGFDMRFSANGMWGPGLYFAANASYSNGYAHVLDTGLKQFFLAEVLVGEEVPLNPNSQLRLPPERVETLHGQAVTRYDSVTGTTGGSQVHILYENGRAYPHYLISYSP